MNHELWAAAAGEVVNKSLQVAQVSDELTPGSSLASGLLGFAQVHSSGLPWCWLQALPSSFPTARCLGKILEVVENQSLAGHLRPQLEVDGIAFQKFFSLPWDSLLLCKPGWPWSYSVAQANFELVILQAGATMSATYCPNLSFFLLQERVSLCISGCPGAHSLGQAGLELRDLLASHVQFVLVVNKKKEILGWVAQW